VSKQDPIPVEISTVTVEVKTEGKTDGVPVPTHVTLRHGGFNTGWQPLNNGKCVFAVPKEMDCIEIQSVPPGFFYRYPEEGSVEGGMPDGAHYIFVFKYKH
jgi:hypothetical protein